MMVGNIREIIPGFNRFGGRLNDDETQGEGFSPSMSPDLGRLGYCKNQWNPL